MACPSALLPPQGTHNPSALTPPHTSLEIQFVLAEGLLAAFTDQGTRVVKILEQVTQLMRAGIGF